MKKPNVIMVILDGLRRDKLDLCPNLMKIAKENAFFPNMFTAAPYTLASMNSVFSGMYPYKNGVNAYYNMFKFKKDSCKTLTQYLKDDGYYTHGEILSDAILQKEGFDELYVYDEKNYDAVKRHKELITTQKNKNAKFFLYLHLIYLHTKVVESVGKKYSDFDKEYFDNKEKNAKNYEAHLAYVDEYVKEIYEHIKKNGLLDNSIVVFMSDHGVSNGERVGEKMYGSFLYNYSLNTFNIICTQGFNKEIDYNVRTVDIMPTMLDFLDILPDSKFESFDGQSLLPLIEGKENKDRTCFAETGGLNGPWPSPEKHNVFCIIKDGWKLINNAVDNSYELYNIKEDYTEKNNLIKERRDIYERLKIELEKHKLSEDKSIIEEIDI